MASLRGECLMKADGFPRDKEKILREFEVRMRLGDIRRLHDLKFRLAPRWWEPSIVVLLFGSAAGLLASVLLYSDLTDRPFNRFVLFWFGLLIVTLVLTLQVILVRIYNFRRSNDHMARLLEDVRNRQDALQEQVRLMREDLAAAPGSAPGTSAGNSGNEGGRGSGEAELSPAP